MKRFSLVFLIAMNIACGHKGNSGSTNAENETLIPDTGAPAMQAEDPEPKDLDELGFELMEHETIGGLKLGLTAADLIAMIGEPDQMGKNVLWEADGAYHQTYEYPNLGLEVDMVGEENETKEIGMITATSPCTYQTSKGVSIGSTYAKVEAAYKQYVNPDFSDPTTIVAGSIYGGVIFTFENDILIRILVGAGAE